MRANELRGRALRALAQGPEVAGSKPDKVFINT